MERPDGTVVHVSVKRISEDLRRDDERGAALVLLTLVLVLLMVFAAFGVDYAQALSQRRLNQGAVDTALLSGAQDTAGQLQPAAVAAAQAEVIRATYQSLGLDMTPAEWDAEWAACTDPTKPPEYTVTGTSDCVSFTSNLQRIRARLPIIPVETGFGRVVGRDEIDTSAFAVVRIGFAGSGNILPFGLPPAAAGDSEVCLRQGPAPIPAPPCDGPDTGNFGYLDITAYGNEEAPFNTTTNCSSVIVAENISRGVDHAIVVFDGVTRVDRDGCTSGNFNYRPNTLETKPGVGNELHDGFIKGTNPPTSVAGRLTKTPYGTHNWAGNSVDDKPLWEFIGPTLTSPSIPSVCERSSFASGTPTVDYDGDGTLDPPDSHQHMVACVDAYKAAPGMYVPLFTTDSDGNPADEFFDLQRSPRWAYVPEMGAGFAPGNSGQYPIVDFRPVFVQTFYAGCNAGSCGEWNPGEGSTIPGNQKADAVTSLLLPRDMLPQIVNDTGPNSGTFVNYSLVE